MKTYNFEFTTKINFDLPIVNQNFMLKCMPKSCVCQRIFDESLVIEPSCQYSMGEDAFGNKTVSGFIGSEHNSFSFCVKGKASLSKYKIMDELDRLFLYPGEKTAVSDEMNAFFSALDIPEDRFAAVRYISESVGNYMTYEKGETDTTTTAAKAFSGKKGVCQDYAHIVIAFLRKAGIPARYAAGFIEGDGETHAWVEYYIDGAWYGIDPTNRTVIEYGYIKLSHGRDSGDCSVERGCFTSNMGIVTQTSDITVKVGEAV